MSVSIFETERLIVRHFQPSDLDDFAVLCADPQVMRFMGDGQVLPRSEVARWIAVCQQKYATRGYGTSAVLAKGSGKFVGYCGVVRAPERHFDELIYAFVQEAWGKGYATEVARAMLDYVFARSTLDRIYATIDPQNTNSIKIAGKLGLQFEKLEIEEDGPVAFYVIERREWQKVSEAQK